MLANMTICWASQVTLLGVGTRCAHRPANAGAVRYPGHTEEDDRTPEIDWDGEVIALEGVIFHGFEDRGQERAEAVKENVLAKLDETTVDN